MSSRAATPALLLTASLVVALAGCGSPYTPGPSPEPTAAPTPAAIDARLVPLLDRIASDPRLRGGMEAPMVEAVTASLPSIDALCVEIAREGSTPLSVAVDVSVTPWDVLAVVAYDPTIDDEPQVMFERQDYPAADLCRHVLGGANLPFPDDPSAIEVTGGTDGPAQVQAIQEALFAAPEDFGVERTGAPAIVVMPMGESVDPARPLCIEGTVYQGGPRARVVMGLVRDGSAWRVATVRVVEQAMHVEQPRAPGDC